METIVVEDVDKNASGWYEITLKDGRKVSTRNTEFADAAFASRGSEVEAEVNSVKKGDFTNHYLNRFGDLEDSARPKRASGGTAKASGRSAETQNDIAKQWAVGRATELMIATGTFNFPLSADDLSNLAQTAQDILKTRDLLK